MAAFAFKNLSQKTLSDLEFSIPSSMNIKVSNESKTKATVTMEAAATGQHNIIFDIQSISLPQRLSGSLSYNVHPTYINLLTGRRMALPLRKIFHCIFLVLLLLFLSNLTRNSSSLR